MTDTSDRRVDFLRDVGLVRREDAWHIASARWCPALTRARVGDAVNENEAVRWSAPMRICLCCYVECAAVHAIAGDPAARWAWLGAHAHWLEWSIGQHALHLSAPADERLCALPLGAVSVNCSDWDPLPPSERDADALQRAFRFEQAIAEHPLCFVCMAAFIDLWCREGQSVSESAVFEPVNGYCDADDSPESTAV